MIATSEFRTLPLEMLHESPLNPRKHFDPVKLQELAQSIAASGVLNPLLARPRKEGVGYELAAGHRRRRAALLALALGGPVDLPVVVREMSDAEFLEILVVENGQREDVHPLEEAEGYRALMDLVGYDVSKIAQRVGRHVDTVYDRLKLLQLIPVAKKLYLANRFTTSHAVILARLTDEQQATALDVDVPGGMHHESLWQREISDEARTEREERNGDPFAGLKPVSPREFQYFVDRTFRLESDSEQLEADLPETAANLIAAEEAELKVVHITREYRVPDAARTDDRTYGREFWVRADGEEDDDGEVTKPCEHAVLGLVVAGPGRGESFAVCVSRDTCRIHWASHIREKAERAKERERGGKGSNGSSADSQYAAQEKRWAREAELRRETEARYTKARTALLEAVAAKLEKAAAGSSGDLAAIILKGLFPHSRTPSTGFPRGRTAEDFVRYAAFAVIADKLSAYSAAKEWPKIAKLFGLNAEKLLNDAAPVDKSDKAKA